MRYEAHGTCRGIAIRQVGNGFKFCNSARGDPDKNDESGRKLRRHAMFGGVFARAAAAAGGRAGLRLYGVNAFMT